MAIRGIPLKHWLVFLGMVIVYSGVLVMRGILAWCGRHVRRSKVGKFRGAGAYDLADFSTEERDMVELAESPHPLAGHVLGMGELEPFVDQRGDTGLRSTLSASAYIRDDIDWDVVGVASPAIRRGRVGIGGVKWDQSG